MNNKYILPAIKNNLGDLERTSTNAFSKKLYNTNFFLGKFFGQMFHRIGCQSEQVKQAFFKWKYSDD